MVTSDYNDYSSVCLAASQDEEFLKSFKRNNTYRAILEHTSYEQGMGYLELIEKSEYYKSIPWDRVYINDSIGDPITSKFIVNEKQVDVSPSTLRYVYYAIETLNFFKLQNKEPLNIIEIGGGYGGQCYIINVLASLLNVEISNYAILDLYGPSRLTNKYLELLLPNTKARAYTLQEIELPKKQNNVLISNYAFAEFDENVRQQYIDKVLVNTSVGYIAWNSESPYDNFFNTCTIEVKEEVPKTGFYNKILTYINQN